MLPKGNVGHSAAAGSGRGVITVSPAAFVLIHRIKWEGKKLWPLQKKKSLGGVGDIVQLSVVKVIDYEQGQALPCYI